MLVKSIRSLLRSGKAAPESTEKQPWERPAHLPARTVPKLELVQSMFYPTFWGFNNPEQFADDARAFAAQLPPGYFASDNCITFSRNNSMFDDLVFVHAWQSNAETGSDRGIVFRRYILATSAFHCSQLDGDFVECGAYTGVGVKTVVDYLGGTEFPKDFWAYDVFEHRSDMPNDPMPGLGPDLYRRVQQKFADYPQVHLVQGLIPDSFKDNCPERIAYLHIDLNQAQAEIAALEHLFDRVVPGGMVILDDYEWAGIYRPQKLAEDEWFDKRGYRVMPLPTGQGLLIKR